METILINGRSYRLLRDEEVVAERKDLYANGDSVTPERWGEPSLNSRRTAFHKVYRVVETDL